MSVSTIKFQGQEYKVRTTLEAIPKTCGWCHNGLVYYVIWKNDYPYSFVGLCNCQFGKGYHIFVKTKKGEGVLVKPDLPTVNPRDVELWPEAGLKAKYANNNEGCSDPDPEPQDQEPVQEKSLEDSVPF